MQPRSPEPGFSPKTREIYDFICLRFFTIFVGNRTKIVKKTFFFMFHSPSVGVAQAQKTNHLDTTLLLPPLPLRRQRFASAYPPPAIFRSCSPPLQSTPRGFEPLRAEPNGFRVHLLSRSDTVSSACSHTPCKLAYPILFCLLAISPVIVVSTGLQYSVIFNLSLQWQKKNRYPSLQKTYQSISWWGLQPRIAQSVNVGIAQCKCGHRESTRGTNEAREIRTPTLLIWSQTRCRCAIAP